MSEEAETDAGAEIAALRAEVKELREVLGHVVNVLGLEDWPGEGRPAYATLDAEAIALRRSASSIPIVLRADPKDASISLWDEKTCCRAQWIVDKDGARLEILNAEHQVVVSIGEAKDGSGEIRVNAPDGTVRSGLRVADDGDGVAVVTNAKGAAMAFLRGGEFGGQVMVASVMGKPAASLKATEQGGLMAIHEPGGQLMGFFAGTTDFGTLSVYGPHGSLAASLSSDEEGGAVAFFNLEGEVRSSLP